MIKIWRPPHVAFAADLLVRKLKSMGERVSLVDSIDPRDECLYIIYNAASIKRLPTNYIVYQTEVAGSKWFSRKYADTLTNALAIWEYDAGNIKAYEHLNSAISIVTPGYDAEVISADKDIPLLFYGYIKKSQIRSDLLKSLSKDVDIRIVENELTTNMWDILRRTAVVLNIHYYENAPLETFRINESLSFGCHVISQTSPTIPEKYNNIVSFADSREAILSALNAFSDTNTRLLNKGKLAKLSNEDEIEQAMARPLALRKPKNSLIKQFFARTRVKNSV